jgi:hypothetical protein
MNGSFKFTTRQFNTNREKEVEVESTRAEVVDEEHVTKGE